MPEQSDLDRRLRAVERALTDGDHDVAALEDAAAMADRLDDIEGRIVDLEEQIAELDAATQAVRGYVGNVRSVNEAVEDRADAALAAVDRIEDRLDAANARGSSPTTTETVDRQRMNDPRSNRADESDPGASHANQSSHANRPADASQPTHASRSTDTSQSTDASRSTDSNQSTHVTTNGKPGSTAGDDYGIEMPAPDANSTANGSIPDTQRPHSSTGDNRNDSTNEEDRSVIDRVREVL